jgi:hypothetical protein
MLIVMSFSSSQPTQADNQAAIVEGLLAQLEPARRDGNTPLEPAIGNFQTADRAGESFCRHGTLALDHQRAAIDRNMHVARRDAGERNQNPILSIGLDDVDRRLP